MIWGGRMPCRDPYCPEAYRLHYHEDEIREDEA